MKKILSKYSIEARFFPTIVGLIPFYVLQYYYLGNFLKFELFQIEIISNISLSLVILYFFAEVPIRYAGKLYEDKMFDYKLNFPSTNFLMHSNAEYGDDFKNQLRRKIESDFSLVLSDKKEETENEKEARKKIKDVIGLMISKVKDGHLLLKQNIAYGFVRNLLFASVVGVILSVILIFFAYKDNDYIFYFGVILMIAYIFYLFIASAVIDYFSKNYARKLIEEYYKS